LLDQSTIIYIFTKFS